MKVVDTRSNSAGRYEVKQKVLLFNQNSFAEIVDIDEHGATCRAFIDIESMESPDIDIELLNCDAGVHVKGITCRVVNDIPVKQGAISSSEETCTLIFSELSQKKKAELECFINKSCFKVANTNQLH